MPHKKAVQPMNIIERGRAHLQSLVALVKRSVWDWKRCPTCGGMRTSCWGTYTRHPWTLGRGREAVRVQRHKCHDCDKTYSEQSALLVGGSWYAREVHRCAVDHWQHDGVSLRRTAELLRSWLGRQERWLLWRPLDEGRGERCYLAASTIHRWLDGAGKNAKASVDGQLAGIAHTRAVGTDGLWAKLKGQAQRVVLLVVDSVSGLIYPPVVAKGEESAGPWQQLFERAKQAGLDWDALRGVTSDGAQGLISYLRRGLAWVQHQRCVWHLWRNLGGDLAEAASKAAEGLAGELAEQARKQIRDELGQLIHQIIDAQSYDQAEAALATLLGHPLGATIGKLLNEQLDRVLVHLLEYYRGLQRITPEWYWRDFRLRLSRGRNHRSDQRLERATLVWAVYHNFEPAQWRSERKRHYRYPGQSALAVAGAPPGKVSYLDALGV
jgi:transposase-like protein